MSKARSCGWGETINPSHLSTLTDSSSTAIVKTLPSYSAREFLAMLFESRWTRSSQAFSSLAE